MSTSKYITSSHPRFKNLTGQRFGRLVAIETTTLPGTGKTKWLCHCDCGNEKVVTASNLQSGNTQSCGCMSRKLTSERLTIDLNGKTFGRWTVLGRAQKHASGSVFWLCRCECGNIREVSSATLTRGISTSCGCYQREHTSQVNTHDLQNQCFGRLTVIERAPNRNGNTYWVCRCECGETTVVIADNLVSGQTQSCGCLQKERAQEANTTHGLSDSPEYNTWQGMRARCFNEAADSYRYYGARGITVCERWGSFENFYADLGPRPSPKHSLDRIDVNGNYEPSNCRWATDVEQANNKRTSPSITLDGRTMTIAQWSRETGITIKTIRERIKQGWSPEDTLEWR